MILNRKKKTYDKLRETVNKNALYFSITKDISFPLFEHFLLLWNPQIGTFYWNIKNNSITTSPLIISSFLESSARILSDVLSSHNSFLMYFVKNMVRKYLISLHMRCSYIPNSLVLDSVNNFQQNPGIATSLTICQP